MTHRNPVIILAFSVSPGASLAFSTAKNTNITQPDSNPSPNIYTGLTLLLFTLFFIITFSLFYYFLTFCFRSGSGRTGPVQRTQVLDQVGLDPTIIEGFPVLLYSEVKQLKIGKIPLECVVCLSAFEDDETLRFIPVCDHAFHVECVDTWLAGHTTCPHCRSDLIPRTGESTGKIIPVSNSEPREERNDVVLRVNEGDKEVGNGRLRSFAELWRWNSTGHVAEIGRGEESEVFTLTRTQSCIVMVGSST